MAAPALGTLATGIDVAGISGHDVDSARGRLFAESPTIDSFRRLGHNCTSELETKSLTSASCVGVVVTASTPTSIEVTTSAGSVRTHMITPTTTFMQDRTAVTVSGLAVGNNVRNTLNSTDLVAAVEFDIELAHVGAALYPNRAPLLASRIGEAIVRPSRLPMRQRTRLVPPVSLLRRSRLVPTSLPNACCILALRPWTPSQLALVSGVRPIRTLNSVTVTHGAFVTIMLVGMIVTDTAAVETQLAAQRFPGSGDWSPTRQTLEFIRMKVLSGELLF